MEMEIMALKYEEMGFSILPIQARDKKPQGAWKQYQKKRLKPDEIREIWGNAPLNVGIVTGTISNLIVVDTDTTDAEEWANSHLPPTLRAKTAKGWHRYYRHPGGRIGNTTGWQGIQGLDIRGDGGYVVAPPSHHPSGTVYVWGGELRPPEIIFPGDPQPQPQPQITSPDVGDKRAAILEKKLRRACQEIRAARDGEKHDTLRDMACLMGGYLHYGIDEQTIIREMIASLPSTTRDKRAAEQTIRDGLEWGRANPLVLRSRSPKRAVAPTPESVPAESDRSLPPGYLLNNGILYRGERPIYLGEIWVAEVGLNLTSGEQTVLVRWQHGNRTGEAVIPRAELGSWGMARILGGAGCAIHAQNAKDVSRYLVEFIQTNSPPLSTYSEYYGKTDEGGILLPGGGVGTAARYIGRPITVGTDRTAYPDFLRVAQAWAPGVFWAVLAFGLASPLIAKMGMDRNPIVHLGGASGSGKTTVCHLTTGAFTDPRVAPWQIQCGSGTTTPKGLSTALLQANGLPLLFDDIQKMLERKKQETEGIIYDFANGQNRSWGTPGNRTTGGGQEIRGTLLTAGETSLAFLNAGSNNRVFSINCSITYPLGCPARTNEGLRRAREIQRTWEIGAGTFGHQLVEHALRDWKRFQLDVRAFELDRHLEPLQAWRRLIATAAATLQMVAGIAELEIDIDALMRQWCDILQENNQIHDPAQEAWERVRLLAIQSVMSQDGSWHYLHYDRKLIAARRDGQKIWRFLHTTPEWRGLVGENAVEMFGEKWREMGYVQAHRNGLLSATCWIGNGSPRTLLVVERGGLYDGQKSGEDS